jgi:hypothetical protein
VIENYIPALQQLPPGETVRVVARTSSHVGFEEYDLAAQTRNEPSLMLTS